jgi:hypothetical protein
MELILWVLRREHPLLGTLENSAFLMPHICSVGNFLKGDINTSCKFWMDMLKKGTFSNVVQKVKTVDLPIATVLFSIWILPKFQK